MIATFADLRRVMESLPPAPPEVRPSALIPRGKAYEIQVPAEFRRPRDPERVIYVNPEDFKEMTSCER